MPLATVLAAALAALVAGVHTVVAGDPRPTADLPDGVAAPVERRPSRRAVRRAARWGVPPDSRPLPRHELRPPAPPAAPAGPPPHEGRAVTPISVETTLRSPFQPDAAARPTVHRHQPYGAAADARQRFDVHLPSGCAGGSLPLVVWIPGGEWQGGPRADCPVAWLVDHGYVVACVGYRPADAAAFPAQLDDCRDAIATLMRDADLWGIDRSRVCVMGAGGGGHLALLVGFASGAPRQPAAADHDVPPAVTAVCAIAAPAQLTALGGQHDRAASAASRLVGGPLPELREAALAASPLVHVTPDDPPTLVIHGTRDTLIPSDQAVRLDRGLAAAGVDHTLALLDAGHGIPLDPATPAAAEIVHFLDRTLGPGLRTAPPAAR